MITESSSMDTHRSSSSNIDDNVGIPEDLRCKRSDGKQWRCSALSMPDKTVCEKHYIQAKKRAANSALRASLKKAKRKPIEDEDIYLESKSTDLETNPMSTKGGPENLDVTRKTKERMTKNHPAGSRELGIVRGSSTRNSLKSTDDMEDDYLHDDDTSATSGSSSPSGSQKSLTDRDSTDHSGRSTESSGEASGQACHQCHRSSRRIIWCSKCGREGYCTGCVSKWYSDLLEEDIQSACPGCRGICNCRLCLSADNLVKVKMQQASPFYKLQYLHHLLLFVLPVLKRIHHEQSSEVEMDKRIYGGAPDIPRVRIRIDDEIFCDCCGMPIVDYHRHCADCSYDLCLACCHDLRSTYQDAGQTGVEMDVAGTRKDGNGTRKSVKSDTAKEVEESSCFDFRSSFQDWVLNSDGSIPCPSKGNCGCQPLTLRRVFKLNWLPKLQRLAEEIASGCKISEKEGLQACYPHMENQPLETDGARHKVGQSSHKYDRVGKILYSPASHDVNYRSFGHFQMHWTRGEPVIIRNVFPISSMSLWDPMEIWRGIRETAEERFKDVNRTVNAVDCLNWSQVEIELGQFLNGYSEGRIHENGWPQMLKLKDWPSLGALEEFLLYHRAEFVSSLPLLEYIHSRWGFLNVAAKLPNGSLEVGPKLSIAYGTFEELGRGDSTSNIRVNGIDVVYLLVHTSEVKFQGWQRAKIEKLQKTFRSIDLKSNSGDDKGSDLNIKAVEKMDEGTNGFNETMKSQDRQHAGALWDVFSRQDIEKVNDFLKTHMKEFSNSGGLQMGSMVRPLHDELFFLTEDHKRRLKEQYNVEPWTFEQHVGEAVFIPAGSAFQVRSLQSSVQFALEFLSPESLHDSLKVAEEVRFLPNDNKAKQHPLEVKYLL